MTSTSSGSVDENNTLSTAAQNDVVFWQDMDKVQAMQREEVAQDLSYEKQQESLSGQILANFETEMENLTDPAGGSESLTPINVAANPTIASNRTTTASTMTNRINQI